MKKGHCAKGPGLENRFAGSGRVLLNSLRLTQVVWEKRVTIASSVDGKDEPDILGCDSVATPADKMSGKKMVFTFHIINRLLTKLVWSR